MLDCKNIAVIWCWFIGMRLLRHMHYLDLISYDKRIKSQVIFNLLISNYFPVIDCRLITLKSKV